MQEKQNKKKLFLNKKYIWMWNAKSDVLMKTEWIHCAIVLYIFLCFMHSPFGGFVFAVSYSNKRSIPHRQMFHMRRNTLLTLWFNFENEKKWNFITMCLAGSAGSAGSPAHDCSCFFCFRRQWHIGFYGSFTMPMVIIGIRICLGLRNSTFPTMEIIWQFA